MNQQEYLKAAFDNVPSDAIETMKTLHCNDGRALGIVPWRDSVLVYADADAATHSVPKAFKHRVLDVPAGETPEWAHALQDRAAALLNSESVVSHRVCVNRKALLDILHACEQDVVQLECLPDVFSSDDSPVALAATRDTLALVHTHMYSGRKTTYTQDALCVTDGDTIALQLGVVQVTHPRMPLRIAFTQVKPKEKLSAKDKLKIKMKLKRTQQGNATAVSPDKSSLRDRLKQRKQKE